VKRRILINQNILNILSKRKWKYKMGVVRTIKSEDGKPYVSLEDLIGEIESVKKSFDYLNGLDYVKW